MDEEKKNVNAAPARAPVRAYDPQVKGSSIENLWVLLVPEAGAKTPMLARAGRSDLAGRHALLPGVLPRSDGRVLPAGDVQRHERLANRVVSTEPE
jgi:hypothetical protein